MTVLCPHGHQSGTTDYCDQCGAPIAAASSPPPTALGEELEDHDTAPAVRPEPCPACGAHRSGDDRFCEGCGHDFIAPQADAAAWEAVVSADRAQFERFTVDGVSFPTDFREKRFLLEAPRMRIGRSRGREQESIPEIDLADSPADPGISRLHAILERQPDGTYAVRDLGSTNGTTLNDDSRPVGTEQTVSLVDGDRIRIGAWTTITVRARARLRNHAEPAAPS